MLIITLRTDKPEAEIGLYDDHRQLSYDTWLAHRQLAETLHKRMQNNLIQIDKGIHDIEAIVVYEGPGSFTGLRIGITVANALAASLAIPIVAAKDPDWLEVGIDNVLQSKNDTIVVPEYGALPHVTAQKK